MIVNGRYRDLGYNHTLSISNHPHGSLLKVLTPERGEFLRHGSEEVAQKKLIELAQTVRRLSGGTFLIHRYMGAVWNTVLTPVVPKFRNAYDHNGLTMLICLRDDDGNFIDGLRPRLPQTIMVPSPEHDKDMEYEKAAHGHAPNQLNRDNAGSYRTEWQRQFEQFNTMEGIPPAMQLTNKDLSILFSLLDDNGFHEQNIVHAFYEE